MKHHRSARVKKPVSVIAVFLAGAMLAAACGGGSSKKTTAVKESTTVPAQASTSSSVETATTVAGATTTSAATSATTAKPTASKSATTVRKSVTATTAAGFKAAPIAAAIVNATTTSSTVPRTDIQSGGTINKLMATDFNNLDPAYTTASSLDGGPTFAIYDTLLYDARDSSIVPNLAEAMTSGDGRIWTLKLRPNIKFSDGTTLDAAAVKANWDRIADPAIVSSQAASVKNIASLEPSADGLSLKITLKALDAQFPRTVVNISFIASPTAITKQGKDNFGQNPVGAGPFLFKSWTHGSQIITERNPNYWNAPRPYVDRIVFKFIGDEQQRLNAFKTGEGNQIQVTSPDSADQLVKAGGQGPGQILSGGHDLHFSLNKAPVNDLRVRQAIYASVDLKQLAKTLHGDPPTLAPLDSVFTPQSPLYDKNQLQPAFDAVKAQQLWTAAAATLGKPVEFTILVFNLSAYIAEAQFIAASINAFKDVKVTLDVQSTQAVVSKVFQQDYQVATFANLFNDPDPKWGNSFTSAASPSTTGWKNAAYDADIADAKATLDGAKRIADFRDALKQFYAEMPAYYYDHSTIYTYGAPNVMDVDASGNGLDLLDRIWIKSRG